MEKTVKERIINAVKPSEDYVNFFNDGTITTDSSKDYKDMRSWASSPFYNSVSMIEDYFVRKAGWLAEDNTDFDSLYMDLKLGLVVKSEDVSNENKIKPGSKPINNIVRFYTGSVQSFSEGKKTDETANSLGYQGYVNYHRLVSAMEREGLVFNGPRSFKEFKELILSGETFDVGISAFIYENAQQDFARTRKR